jgi:hypothetical protein
MAASDIISGKHQTGPGLGSLETLCLLELLDLMRPHREVSHQPRTKKLFRARCSDVEG